MRYLMNLIIEGSVHDFPSSRWEVVLANKSPRNGRADAFLNADGSITIDGIGRAPGDFLYLIDGVFKEEPTKDDIERAKKMFDSRIAHLVKLSGGIDRTIAKVSPVAKMVDDDASFEDWIEQSNSRFAWRKHRYPAEYNTNKDFDWIDRVGDAHDPVAIEAAFLKDHFDETKFVIGGYLAPTASVNTPAGLRAMRLYRQRGGSLGHHALTMLGEPVDL